MCQEVEMHLSMFWQRSSSDHVTDGDNVIWCVALQHHSPGGEVCQLQGTCL